MKKNKIEPKKILIALVIFISIIFGFFVFLKAYSILKFQKPNLPAENIFSKKTEEKPLWGAYNDWEKSSISDFESKIGASMDLIAVFVHWGNENSFPTSFAEEVKKTKKILVIFWEAKDYNDESVYQPQFSYDSITSGKWDSYILSFAKQAKEHEGQIILIPFEEMNGNWNSWAITKNSNSPKKHIDAYRYIRNIFKDSNNVKFGWAINSDSIPDSQENRYENYYPGNDYVDYVGIDGFNFDDPWQNFNEIFSNALSRLEKYNKPIYIFSFASAEGPLKANWITDALTIQIPKNPNIKGWIWFNENKEKDWRIDSDKESLNAFINAIK